MATPTELCLDVRRLCKDWGIGATSLSSPIDAAQTRIVVEDWPQDLGPGAYAEIGVELMQVVSVGAAMQVKRGIMGTTPAIAAAGSIVVFQPRFTNTAIIDALNRALSVLSHRRPRIVTLTDTSLVVSDATDEYPLPESTAGFYRRIAKVEIEIGSSGRYREITNFEELHEDGDITLRLLGEYPVGKALRVIVDQDYEDMEYGSTSPTGLREFYDRFLVEFAAGTLLEYDDIYAADWARQVPGQPDLRGRQQAIGRQYQIGALSFLEASDSSSGHMVRRSDLRNYRL